MDIPTTAFGDETEISGDNAPPTISADALPADDVAAVDQLRLVYQEFKNEIGKVIIGQ